MNKNNLNQKNWKTNRKKRKEGIRILAAGALAVFLFGGGFLALNHFVSAAEYDKPVKLKAPVMESVQDVAKLPVQEAKQTPTQAAPYEKADYEVEVDQAHKSNNKNAISAQEAADIGAKFLWDVYKKDLSGCKIYMTYAKDPSRGIGYWHGYVTEKGGSRDDSSFGFGIEAISGERDTVLREERDVSTRKTVPYQPEKTTEFYRQDNEKYLQKAMEYAGFLLSAKPVKAEFKGIGAVLAPGYEYEIPEGLTSTMVAEDDTPDPDTIIIPYGEEIPASVLYMEVVVTDEQGNQADMAIDVSDLSLSFMNKLYDGVNYDPGSIG